MGTSNKFFNLLNCLSHPLPIEGYGFLYTVVSGRGQVWAVTGRSNAFRSHCPYLFNCDCISMVVHKGHQTMMIAPPFSCVCIEDKCTNRLRAEMKSSCNYNGTQSGTKGFNEWIRVNHQPFLSPWAYINIIEIPLVLNITITGEV